MILSVTSKTTKSKKPSIESRVTRLETETNTRLMLALKMLEAYKTMFLELGIDTETPKSDGRKKSRLTRVSDAVQRWLLLNTLIKHGWNLSKTAKELEMSTSAVIRSIKILELDAEYEEAKHSGLAKMGRPTEKN